MKAKHAAFLLLLLVAALVIWKISRPAKEAAQDVPAQASEVPGDRPSAGPGGGAKDRESGNPPPQDAIAEDGSAPPAKSPATRARIRDSVVSSSGARKTVIDPMASWPELPAWPEGPRLFAEVETSSRRYINLRPDDAGEMPRIRAEAEERIELRINFPEGEPGEKIHVELPNGGSFADSDAKGRVFTIPENRTLSFPYITDEARGHCNVKLRHRGHTRSLPVWVGELPAAGS